jgi:LCP family protein required for cell wall assembly
MSISLPHIRRKPYFMGSSTTPKSEPSSSREPSPIRRRTPTKKRRQTNRFRGVGIFFIVLLSLVAFYGGYTYRHSSAIRRYLPILMQPPKSMADVFPNTPAFNILIIGRDYDYNNSDQVIKTHARSDMLMVARVDIANDKISLLSIPRDTRADVPGYGIGKINGAHAHGGPKLTAETIETNFGVQSDKYVALDFQGFEQAIDRLGGVDLVVDKKMDYDDNWGHLHIHLKPGPQHLSGAQAMGFVRFRHSDSDIVRVQRQQALLAAIKDKLKNPATLAMVPDLLDIFDRHLDSDLTDEQKVTFARFIHDTPRDQIKMETLPSVETNGPFVLTDWAKAGPMIQGIFGVDPPSHIVGDSPGIRHRHHKRHVSHPAATV